MGHGKIVGNPEWLTGADGLCYKEELIGSAKFPSVTCLSTHPTMPPHRSPTLLHRDLFVCHSPSTSMGIGLLVTMVLSPIHPSRACISDR